MIGDDLHSNIKIQGINKAKRVEILKLLVKYICHVHESNDRIDVDALNFLLDLNYLIVFN